MSTQEPYRKAAGTDRGMSHYDLMARLGMRERSLKGRVIELAQVGAGQRLLDLGCGTGTLVLMARRRLADATVIGVDGDPTILCIARRKAQRAGILVEFDEGMAYALPYGDGTFDAVVSTLTFHHLTMDQQERTLAEVRRVLRPGGRLVIADLAPPHNALMRLLRRLPFQLHRRHGRAPGSQQHLHAPSDDRPHQGTQLEDLLTTNGWQRIAPIDHFMSIMGTIAVRVLTPPGQASAPRL